MRERSYFRGPLPSPAADDHPIGPAHLSGQAGDQDARAHGDAFPRHAGGILDIVLDAERVDDLLRGVGVGVGLPEEERGRPDFGLGEGLGDLSEGETRGGFGGEERGAVGGDVHVWLIARGMMGMGMGIGDGSAVIVTGEMFRGGPRFKSDAEMPLRGEG